jgi:hypothetical protein
MSTPPKEVLNIRSGTIFLEDGILRVVVDTGGKLDLADARANIAAAAYLAGSRKVPVLVDMANIRTMSREARSYIGGEDAARFTSAVALLVGSPVSKVVGNFFLGLNRTPFPARLFTSESEAVSWLKGFLK